MSGTCPPGEHSHSDRPNFTFEDYAAMCRAGDAKFSMSEAARIMGVSRQFLYRAEILASVPEDEFEAAIEHVLAQGLTTTTALADEIKRRTGKAKANRVACPHCGETIRVRYR